MWIQNLLWLSNQKLFKRSWWHRWERSSNKSREEGKIWPSEQHRRCIMDHRLRFRIQPYPSRQTDRHTHTVIIGPAALWDNEEFFLAGVQVFSVQRRRERVEGGTPIKETQHEAVESDGCRWRSHTSWSHRTNISQQLTTLRAFSPGGIFFISSLSCCCAPQQHWYSKRLLFKACQYYTNTVITLY